MVRRLHVLLLLVSFGCGSSVVSGGRPCASSTDCPASQVCRDGRCQSAGDAGPMDASGPLDFGDPHAHDVIGITITPPMATLTSISGSMPTQAFTASFLLHDGTTAPATAATWSFDTLPLGNIDPSDGLFTASGVVGGTGMVTAMATDATGATIMATATVTVNLQTTVIGPGADMTTAARFATAPMPATDPRAAHVVYPLDNAVMPQNVYPADVQWTVGATGDAFRISLTKTHVTVTGYVGYTANLDWLVDATAWHAVAQTDPDEQAVITVDRVDTATGDVITTTPVHVTFAKGSISGSVYYWDIAAGRIQRIDDGTGTHVEFMPYPPAGIDGAQCVGCHTVSRSGRYMAGRLGGGDNIGAMFDLTLPPASLMTNPAPTVWTPSVRWWFSSWNQDDTRLIAEENMSLELLDPMTGATIIAPGTGGLPSAASNPATHPSWAPDGHAVAILGNVVGWGGDNSQGDIQILPVTGTDTFGAPTTIHVGTSLSTLGTSDAYPSYAPDSHHIAFAHGSTSRSETGMSSLYYMDDTGAGFVPMATAATSNLDFQPRFSPFDVGGYFWLSFLSRRDYGNAGAGTAGMDLQQIRIIAIRKDTPAGMDPSSVPYWLPGQSNRSRNIAAYWAPRACRDDGTSCDVDSECCSGVCGHDPTTGALVCSPPPPAACHTEGMTCSTDADCCSGGSVALTCTMHICTPTFG